MCCYPVTHPQRQPLLRPVATAHVLEFATRLFGHLDISFHPQPANGEYRLEEREEVAVAHRTWKNAAGSHASVDVAEWRDKNVEGSHDGGFAAYDQCVIEGLAEGVRLILDQRHDRANFEYFTIDGHGDAGALERVIREVQLEETLSPLA
jgi:hypothetical protein